MAFLVSLQYFLRLFVLISLVHFTSAARRLNPSTNHTHQAFSFQHHNGALLTGKISINLIWYGNFKPLQRAIITNFIASLYSAELTTWEVPTVATWWEVTRKYYNLVKYKKASSLVLSLGTQILDERYSIGKSLTSKQIIHLASKGGKRFAINVVLTASDVVVEGFCSSRCGTHGSALVAEKIRSKNFKFAYIWVGNSETQCPGQCARPFHKSTYGPQSKPLVAPNDDVGIDGMVINLASLLAGTVTNPFGNGYFHGPKEAPLEAASACAGIYDGDLKVDPITGANYNAYGVDGKEYVLPALFDPSTSTCLTLV